MNLQEAIAQLPPERQQLIRAEVNETLANQYKQVRDMLPDNLFPDSGIWQSMDTILRLEFLICIYRSQKAELEQLSQPVNVNITSTKPTDDEIEEISASVNTSESKPNKPPQFTSKEVEDLVGKHVSVNGLRRVKVVDVIRYNSSNSVIGEYSHADLETEDGEIIYANMKGISDPYSSYETITKVLD